MKEFSKSSEIEDLIKTSVEKVKVLMETNTIVGEPMRITESTVIVPISKASVGFVAGGGEYSDKSNRRVANHFPMAGGSSGGMSVTPVGFLIESEGEIKFINVENKSLYQTILNMFNALLNKVQEKENEEKEDEQES